ncbi:MAG: hypothetical protein AVDCRST_MAG11-3322, partial [uncultured Gemmatimonadaceae bacterium]
GGGGGGGRAGRAAARAEYARRAAATQRVAGWRVRVSRCSPWDATRAARDTGRAYNVTTPDPRTRPAAAGAARRANAL